MPRWRKRSQKSVLEVFEVNVLSFQGACVKNVTLNRPICRATHDIKLDIIPQWDHILYDEENFLRIPEQLRTNGKEFCQNIIGGAIGSVKKRIEANYKKVVPQLYNDKIQLLVPLYLTNPDKPDLALVLSLSDDKTVYYGHTCLTTEMAYNNARLIARPDSYWLQP